MRICRNRSGPEPAQSLVVDLQKEISDGANICSRRDCGNRYFDVAGQIVRAERRHTVRGFAASARHEQRRHRSILRLRHEYRTGVTTGSTGSLGTGMASAPQQSPDAAINEENKTIDRKLKGICRGC